MFGNFTGLEEAVFKKRLITKLVTIQPFEKLSIDLNPE